MENEGKRTLYELMAGIGLCFVLFLLPALFAARPLSWVLGVALGAAVALSMSVHMYRTLLTAMLYDRKTAAKKTKRGAIVRALLMLAGLMVSAAFPDVFSIIGTLLGILCLKFSAYLQPITHKVFTKLLKKGR